MMMIMLTYAPGTDPVSGAGLYKDRSHMMKFAIRSVGNVRFFNE